MKRAILILIAGLLLILGQAAFAVDTDLPTLTMASTLPAYVKATPSISGTAVDMSSGISGVWGMIYYFDDAGVANYWDGSAWVASGIINPISFTTPTTGTLYSPWVTVSWNYTFPALVNNRTYYYQFFARDAANNRSEGPILSTVCDSSNPALAAISPATGAGVNNYLRYTVSSYYINNVQTDPDKVIRYVALDPNGSGQIDRVELTIMRTGDSKYYTSSGWQTSPATVLAQQDSATGCEYYYPLAIIPFSSSLTDNKWVNISAKAYDKAGNCTYLTSLLRVDNEYPDSSITTPAKMTTFPTEISGEATDTVSGVEAVLLKIKRTSGTTIKYWNGLSWQDDSTQIKVANFTGTDVTRIWRFSTNGLFFNNPVTDTYEITASAVDRAGFVETALLSPKKTLEVDNTKTFLSITSPKLAINNISYANEIRALAYDNVNPINPSLTCFGVSRYVDGAGVWYGYKWVPNTWNPIVAPLTDFLIGPTSVSGASYSLDVSSRAATLYINMRNGETLAYGAWATNSLSVIKGVAGYTIYDTSAPSNPTAKYTGVKWSKNQTITLKKDVDFNPPSDPVPAGVNRLASGIRNLNTQLNLGASVIASEVLYTSDPESLTVNMTGGPGLYSLYVQAYDQAGNSPDSQACLQVGYDNVAPVFDGIIYFGSEFTTTTPTFTWNPAVDAHSGIYNNLIYLDGRLVGTTTGASYVVSNEQRLTNGAHTLVIRAVDQVGNYSDLTHSFTVNTQSAPQVSILNPVNGGFIDHSSVDVECLVTDDSRVTKVEMSVNGGAWSTLYSGSIPQIGFNPTVTLDPNVTNTISIRATDDSSLVSEVAVTTIPDTQAPAAFTLLSPTADAWAPVLPQFSWDQSIDALSGLDGYDLYLDSVKVNPELIKTESFTPATALSDGEHSYYVVAWDIVGNYFQTLPITFKIDTVPPTAPTLLTPLEGQSFTSAMNVAWLQSTDADSGLDKYEVYLNNTKMAETSSTSLWVTNTLTDGAYAVKVVARDKAGNTTSSAPVNISINVNAPTIALYVNDKTIANNAQINTLPKIRAEIQDTSGIDPTSIQIYIDDQLQSNLSLQTVSSQATLVTAYNVTKNDVRLAAGTHKLKIVAKDIHGKSTSRELIGLKVSGKAEITGFVMNYPNPFKPLAGTGTTINYTLADDASLKIMIYDLSGRLINKLDCLEGAEGGRFGENNVPWDGKTFVGDALANGAYIYLIVDSKNNVIGSGEMAVYE